MQQTFINLPRPIEEAIKNILSQNDDVAWISSAKELHDRYLKREKNRDDTYLNNSSDALAYLALRFPATYAQISAALLTVQELLPSFRPQTLLDIGAGPGTGVIATQTIWSDLISATCVDANADLISLGKKILLDAKIPTKVLWKQTDIRRGIKESSQYDVVLLANVLNELSPHEMGKLIEEAYQLCSGILIVVEPGTLLGHSLIQSISKKISDSGILIAPYINNSIVEDEDYWIHFSQKFIRPGFQRYIRQRMRESSLMASDWEETKFCYVAVSKAPIEYRYWGRCIGPVEKQKGFLKVPVLTENNILLLKVMKRYKDQYTFAKNLKWGQLIPREDNLVAEYKN